MSFTRVANILASTLGTIAAVTQANNSTGSVQLGTSGLFAHSASRASVAGGVILLDEPGGANSGWGGVLALGAIPANGFQGAGGTLGPHNANQRVTALIPANSMPTGVSSGIAIGARLQRWDNNSHLFEGWSANLHRRNPANGNEVYFGIGGIQSGGINVGQSRGAVATWFDVTKAYILRLQVTAIPCNVRAWCYEVSYQLATDIASGAVIMDTLTYPVAVGDTSGGLTLRASAIKTGATGIDNLEGGWPALWQSGGNDPSLYSLREVRAAALMVETQPYSVLSANTPVVNSASASQIIVGSGMTGGTVPYVERQWHSGGVDVCDYTPSIQSLIAGETQQTLTLSAGASLPAPMQPASVSGRSSNVRTPGAIEAIYEIASDSGIGTDKQTATSLPRLVEWPVPPYPASPAPLRPGYEQMLAVFGGDSITVGANLTAFIGELQNAGVNVVTGRIGISGSRLFAHWRSNSAQLATTAGSAPSSNFYSNGTETLQAAFFRHADALALANPGRKVVLNMMLGTNDIQAYAGFNREEFAQAAGEINALAVARNWDIVWHAPPMISVSAALTQANWRYATQSLLWIRNYLRGIATGDMGGNVWVGDMSALYASYVAEQTVPASYLGDGVHPTTAGETAFRTAQGRKLRYDILSVPYNITGFTIGNLPQNNVVSAGQNYSLPVQVTGTVRGNATIPQAFSANVISGPATVLVSGQTLTVAIAANSQTSVSQTVRVRVASTTAGFTGVFSDIVLTLPAEGVAPAFLGALVGTGGDEVFVDILEAVSPPLLPASSPLGLTLRVDGAIVPVVSITRVAPTRYRMVPQVAIFAGQSVQVRYSAAIGDITDSATPPNELSSGSISATNNSTMSDVAGVTIYPATVTTRKKEQRFKATTTRNGQETNLPVRFELLGAGEVVTDAAGVDGVVNSCLVQLPDAVDTAQTVRLVAFSQVSGYEFIKATATITVPAEVVGGALGPVVLCDGVSPLHLVAGDVNVTVQMAIKDAGGALRLPVSGMAVKLVLKSVASGATAIEFAGSVAWGPGGVVQAVIAQVPAAGTYELQWEVGGVSYPAGPALRCIVQGSLN